MEQILNFKEGDLVYCTKIPGIHKVVRAYAESNNSSQTLITELLYNTKYEKVLAKATDREYTVSAAYCKPVDLKAMLTFEQKKFEKVKTMVQRLDLLCHN